MFERRRSTPNSTIAPGLPGRRGGGIAFGVAARRSRTIAFGVAILMGGATRGTAQDSAAAAERRARELVALINTADVADLRAYVDSAFSESMRAFPPEAHVGFIMNERSASGGLDFDAIQQSDATIGVARVRKRVTGDWQALAVRIEPQPPHRISGIGSREPDIPEGALEPPPTADAARVDALAEYVRTLAAADIFSGAVLLAKDGEILYSEAFGEANKDFEAPNTVDTKFNLGSMNKMFTAVAIAQLVERGELSFDDPLLKFLPDFPDPESAGKIRIEHLLTHTSGLGSYFNDTFQHGARNQWRTVDELMTLAEGDSLRFEPGTEWSYSNTGFLVLGKVIEVVSGQDYHDYVRAHIHEPAGMTSTAAYELDYVTPNLAVGYDKTWDADGEMRYRNNLFEHVIRGGPAGGGYSTVGDLERFAEALTDGRLVGEEYVALLTSPKPELSSDSYGYGFGASEGSEIVGHSGGFSGISSNLDIFTDSGYVAVVMSNYGGASRDVVRKIRWLLGVG